MFKKVIVIILIIILSGVLCFSYLTGNDGPVLNVNNNEKISLSIVGGSIKLQEMVTYIRTKDYYGGYDEETVQWMERLGDKEVFMSSDELIVMNHVDAEKIPVEFATDVYITYNIKCKLLEQHHLGNSKYPKNVLYVNDVDFINKKIESYEV